VKKVMAVLQKRGGKGEGERLKKEKKVKLQGAREVPPFVEKKGERR